MADDVRQDEQPQGPFDGEYADARDDHTLAKDRAAVQRQADALRPSRRRDAFDRQILRSIVGRRSRTDNETLVPVDVIRRPRGRLTPVVRGELLVRSSLAERAPGVWAMLMSDGFSAEPIPELDDLTRLTSSGLAADELDEIARLVRSNGHEASVNYVAPLQPIVKGEGGPEKTDVAPRFPPAFLSQHESWEAVSVAVIDTGVTDQPRDDGWLRNVTSSGRLNGQTVSGVDPLEGIGHGGFLDFAAGHGTFAAGVVAQVAPKASLLAYRALDSDGIGSEVDIACAMVDAAARGASIINLSLGTETLDDQPLLAIEVALDIIARKSPDVLVVAAAGNTGRSRPVFPAASRRVVAVAGLDAAMTPAAWSTRGWWVDCSGVGQGVVSTYVQGKESPELDPHPDTWDERDPWAVWTGTSFAAPQVSGAVARVCGQTGLSPRVALGRLLDSRPRIPDFGVALRILPGT